MILVVLVLRFTRIFRLQKTIDKSGFHISQKLPILNDLDVQRMNSLGIITDRIRDDHRSLGSALNEIGNQLFQTKPEYRIECQN